MMHIMLDPNQANISNILFNSSMLGLPSEQEYKLKLARSYISIDIYFIGEWRDGNILIELGPI